MNYLQTNAQCFQFLRAKNKASIPEIKIMGHFNTFSQKAD